MALKDIFINDGILLTVCVAYCGGLALYQLTCMKINTVV